MDCSLPGSSVHGLFQARVLEWVAISFSRRSSWPRDLTWVSRIVGRRFSVWATKEVRAGLPQTKKLPGREYNPTHQQIIGLKLLLSKVLPSRARPSFSHHQSLPSESLHKPHTSCIKKGRQKKQEEPQSPVKIQNHITKVNTKWGRDRQPSRKRIQNKDSESDSGSWKRNRDKDWEDARNVY